jgi:tetratricopeptide (TPR) repeat protein
MFSRTESGYRQNGQAIGSPSRFRSAACKVAYCAFSFLLAVHSASAAAGKADAARQLIQSTSLVNVLRTDAEQASLIADQLSEDIPAELRSDLRHVIDRSLGYDEMENALVRSVAVSLNPHDIDTNLRWWASDSGRAVAKMESSVYASIFVGSTFETFNPTIEPPHEVSAADLAQLTTEGHLSEFLTDLLSSTAASRSCLEFTISVGPPCPQLDTANEAALKARASVVLNTAISGAFARVPSGDLTSYETYLRSDAAQTTLRVLRNSLLLVDQQSWSNAAKQSSIAIDTYARKTFGAKREPDLSQTTTDIDNGQNLSRARVTLDLMRRAAPEDPKVLVQSARVVLKLARDLTDNDVAPSVPRIDPKSLQIAERWLDQALTLDSQSADALMIRGHVAYLQFDFPLSVRLLEQAKAIGTDSPWLPINLGDAFWAMAFQQPPLDHALAQKAADEFEAALALKLPDAAELRVVHQLSAIYPELGEIKKADVFQQRYISMREGRYKAYALHRYAHFLLFYAHDVDAAVAAARQAVRLYNFRVGREFLVQILAIKGGLLHEAGRSHEAAPYFAEAKGIEPDLESICPDLAWFPDMLPGVYGIHAEGLIKNFAGSIGGRTLLYATSYATAAQIEQLLSWGANPNYFDAQDGAPLHHAILSDNTAAVKVLLAHGANPLTPYVDSRTPTQLADYPADAKRAEILAMVTKAAGDHASAGGPVGKPLKVGYRYRLKKPLNGNGYGSDSPEGTQFIFISTGCGYTDAALACFVVAPVDHPDQLRDVAFAKDQLSDWKSWFEELGPYKPSIAH